MNKPKQLIFPFQINQKASFESFFCSPDNLNLIARLSEILISEDAHELIIHGEEGAGKSFLMQAICNELSSSKKQFAFIPMKKALNMGPEIFEDLAFMDAVSIDDLQLLLSNKDWETVVSYESKSGTYGTNSDGSFHKPLVIQTAEGWASSNQGGVINVHYPEAIQLSDDVVFVRFYYEGMTEVNGVTSPYRTRVTMNWVNEDGKWVVKTQHYSPAAYGGVHIPQASDFDE